jgi:hypothetical protein
VRALLQRIGLIVVEAIGLVTGIVMALRGCWPGT